MVIDVRRWDKTTAGVRPFLDEQYQPAPNLGESAVTGDIASQDEAFACTAGSPRE